jgi:excisionase family DNA binding protein
MVTTLESNMPKLYRTDEIGEHLGLEPATIRAWIREGKLRARKYGREYLVRADELEAFLSLQETSDPER